MKLITACLLVLASVACGAATHGPIGPSMGANQLKFAVIDTVGAPVYCDPDYYPLARAGGEGASAIAQYDTIRSDTELYTAILAHERLPAGALNDEQKLVLYRAWKLLRALSLTRSGDGYAFSYRVQSKQGTASYLMVAGTIRDDGVVAVASRTPAGAPNCPICLAAGTMISTPSGDERVTDVRPGSLVWTAAGNGNRIAVPVLEVGSIEVPAGHQMVHLVLADGRELLASPGHPAADGRRLGSLAVGDQLNGSTVALWELVPYQSDRTYDLLPAGATGTYWANGILLSSTLTKPLPLPPAAGAR